MADVPVAEEVAETPIKKIQVTCFACYSTASVPAAKNPQTIPCPSCGSAIVVEATVEDSSSTKSFAGLGGSLTERIQQKMSEAYAAEAAENAALASGVLGFIKRI